MFEYFIFIVINSTVYKELNTLKLIDRVKANNTKQALIKAEENLASDVYVGSWHNSKMIAWNSARIGSYCKKDNTEDVMMDIVNEMKNVIKGRHETSFK